MSALIDISGQTFKRLTVLRFAESRNKRAYWHCHCSCGRDTVVMAKLLRNGHTGSCGCLRVDIPRQMQTTHGESGSRLSTIWRGMKTRCYNPRCKAYRRYGGRGIRICEEWLQFEPFLSWSRANGYADHLTIDRIDNDGNYEPANCRWATYAVQARHSQLRYGRASKAAAPCAQP